MLGGSAAGATLLRLRTAQERDINQCQNFQIMQDSDMTGALNWLHNNLVRTNAVPSPAPIRWEERGSG